VTIFYCLIFETSFFVASYDSQGYGGGIRPRLHTIKHEIRGARIEREIEIYATNLANKTKCTSTNTYIKVENL
jgi:hypothetical protein